MNILCVIPARGGSKGIPRKNIKLLGNKPLITYSIDIARHVVDDKNICVSTDDEEIIKVVREYGLTVPFVRPQELSGDFVGTNEVLLHAIDYYRTSGINYDVILLLQPTSPFRQINDVKSMLKLYSSDIDMVVSVSKSKTNPYYNCFEADVNGYLHRFVNKAAGALVRRQDAPVTYEYNGSVYVISVDALERYGLGNMPKVLMYEMDEVHSIDLDTLLDWELAEAIINRHQDLI